MTRVAPVVPAETDILCEHCGYTLNGLPESGNCPECGQPVAESTIGDQRTPPAFEVDDGKTLSNFFGTTASVLFRPTHFYRTTTTRSTLTLDRAYAKTHWAIAAMLFGAAASLHTDWYLGMMIGLRSRWWMWPACGVLIFATFFALDYTTRLAATLTAWEAAYRGIRLPYRAVLRAMHYHAAHYVPVALIAVLTVGGYQVFFHDVTSATMYLYVLCAEVIIGAAYLFHTYWIAMRNMMYANR